MRRSGGFLAGEARGTRGEARGTRGHQLSAANTQALSSQWTCTTWLLISCDYSMVYLAVLFAFAEVHYK